MIKYVVFDFNGTILDDVNLCLNLLNEILTKQNKKPLTLDEYRHVFTFPIKKYYELAGVDFTKDSFEDLSLWFINNYQEASFKEKTYPHLLDVITKLKEKGIKLVILSASQKDNLIKQLEVLKLKDKFDDILGLDNIYAASKVDIAKNFVKENNIDPKDVLAIGDTLHDFEVGRALGFKVLLFSKGHQARDVLAKAGVPIIDDLIDIIDYIN